MIKYSIITVCLNSAKTIERCLLSVNNQIYRNFEHIIIDGLSKDQTLQIVGKYPVKLISEKDNGIYDAMNKGITLSKGEYVLFLNSDDELLPNFLLNCDKVSHNADYIASAINLINGDNIKTWIPNYSFHRNFIWSMPFPHAGLIVKRDIIIKLGGFSTRYKISSDFDFVIKLIKSNSRGIFINDVLLNFYLGGVSQNICAIIENHKVRATHFKNLFFLVIALTLDYLRYIKNKLNSIKINL
jgi:glycosyltransferase involved in cell wall biosynthesis